jgi:carbon-monoxide dehydrogenase large subunit
LGADRQLDSKGRYVGRSIRRVEDHRLLIGRGHYIADLSFTSACHMAVVRSGYPHADIVAIETEGARSMPGVLGIWTGLDVIADGLGGIPWERLPPTPRTEPRAITPAAGDPAIGQPQPILCEKRVRYLGQPVAVVVAETLAQAKDAADAVLVEYQEHRPIMAVREAASAEPLWDQAPGNLCFRTDTGDAKATRDAFAQAAHITEISIENERLVQNPLETRGYVGQYDTETERYTLHAAAGKPQTVGRALARDIFHLAEDRVRVVTKDVGGGFGAKNPLYPEQALVLWSAHKIGRPVRWQADRSEGFLSDYQGRGQATDAEAAFDANGRILALRVRALADLGAYLGPRGSTAPGMWRIMGTSVYDIPVIDFDLRGIHTNRMPTSPYRGAGAPEAAFVLERLLDTAARELDLTPAKIRRRNLIPASAMPYKTAGLSTYDSGDFAAAMDAAEIIADTEGFARRQAESEAKGLRRGIGYGNLLEACGAGIADRADISCAPDGEVSVRIGTMSNGQSHETVYAQMLADRLGIGMERIRIIQGDSNETPWGMGTGACRSMTIGGSALVLAGDDLIENGLMIAADMLEAAPQDIEYQAGRYRIRGTDRVLTLEEIARDRELEASHYYEPLNSTYPNGCHIAEVEVDPETGALTLLRYSMAQDVGRALNPMVVEGQLAGGVAQGVGQALLERNDHDPDSGQLLAGSFMDCALPRADDLPLFKTKILEVPCTHTPTGVKSVGEAGPTAAPAAVINAIVDALAPLGVRHIAMPATPETVYRAIQAAKG